MIPKLSERRSILAVFATHGLLDTAITVAGIIAVKSTEIEGNIWLSRLAVSMQQSEVVRTISSDLGLFYWDLGVVVAGALKLLVVGVAAALLWFGREHIPRAYVSLLWLVGVFVVVTNALVLASEGVFV